MKLNLTTYATREIFTFGCIVKTCIIRNMPKIIMYVNSLLSALAFFVLKYLDKS